MTEESATKLLEWESTRGETRCLIQVVDESKHNRDVDYKRLEVCVLENDEWKTDEQIDYIEQITDYGIPESFVD